MTELNLRDNPFKVFTPEGMSARDASELFVRVADFNKISDPGHAMLNGPRGCGKSMIFRYLMPDCQCLVHDVPLAKLSFLGILVPIKNTVPNLTEFQRLDDVHAKLILNEHVLTSFVLTRVFDSLSQSASDEGGDAARLAREFFRSSFLPKLQVAGWVGSATVADDAGVATVFKTAKAVAEDIYRAINQFAKRLAFPQRDAFSYTGPLFDYLSFLHPLLRELLELPSLPKGPIYLLVDDADYLSHTQTRILNSWVATRTQKDISIKISTQLRYKTFSTASGIPIQCPHDYQEINIADVYTSRKSKYPQKIEEILRKRLQKAGVEASLMEYFPPDQAQEERIADIEREIREKWPTEGRGFRAEDDVTRYSRPEYIRRLGGTSKSTSKYSYAGFEQLVHISSGLIRYFLEPAAQMYDEERSLADGKPVTQIRPSIQDEVVRREAENLMFTEFDKMVREDPQGDVDGLLATSGQEHQKRTEQLRNLIRALGGTFFQKLISDDAERRVFSVAISGVPDPEIVDVFELGVRYGYFHRSSIGNKDGTGRTRLYVLTRRLAPHFNLDPSSFAGYLWVTNDLLREGMENPEKILRRIKKDGISSVTETAQLSLFE
jgi:hypothetical protein